MCIRDSINPVAPGTAAVDENVIDITAYFLGTDQEELQILSLIHILQRRAPIIMPGTILSQLGMQIMAANAWALSIVSTLSAISSRLARAVSYTHLDVYKRQTCTVATCK